MRHRNGSEAGISENGKKKNGPDDGLGGDEMTKFWFYHTFELWWTKGSPGDFHTGLYHIRGYRWIFNEHFRAGRLDEKIPPNFSMEVTK